MDVGCEGQRKKWGFPPPERQRGLEVSPILPPKVWRKFQKEERSWEKEVLYRTFFFLLRLMRFAEKKHEGRGLEL